MQVLEEALLLARRYVDDVRSDEGVATSLASARRVQVWLEVQQKFPRSGGYPFERKNPVTASIAALVLLFFR